MFVIVVKIPDLIPDKDIISICVDLGINFDRAKHPGYVEFQTNNVSVLFDLGYRVGLLIHLCPSPVK
jgi:hypothetical protein